jgi:hypothetical protein
MQWGHDGAARWRGKVPMRIAWLEIENFRSIKHLRLEGLDKPHVVLEGPNDVGKSNILHALDLALTVLPALLLPSRLHDQLPPTHERKPSWLTDEASIFRHGEDSLEISLGIRFSLDGQEATSETLGFVIEWLKDSNGVITSQLSINDALDGNALSLGDFDDKFLRRFAWMLGPTFRLVTTKRSLVPEPLSLGHNKGFYGQGHVRWQGSNLKQLLFLYKNSPELEIQERFEQLREALRDPELGVGTMNVAVQSDQMISVKTRQDGLELDLEQRGSGIQQLVALLALTLCHRGRILAIEEPEMNLSEPNQRLFWKKLREFCGPGGPMNQVFITSHSRIFEEEAERIIVSRDAQQGTQAKWADPAPIRRKAEDEPLLVTRGHSVTLNADILNQLGVQEGKHLFLVPTQHGYQLMGPDGYAQHLSEDDSNASSAV